MRFSGFGVQGAGEGGGGGGERERERDFLQEGLLEGIGKPLKGKTADNHEGRGEGKERGGTRRGGHLGSPVGEGANVGSPERLAQGVEEEDPEAAQVRKVAEGVLDELQGPSLSRC